MQVTVTFTYEADPANYHNSTPEAMARFDEISYRGNTEALLEHIASVPYGISIKVSEKFDKLPTTG
jgi:hypothetical protein